MYFQALTGLENGWHEACITYLHRGATGVRHGDMRMDASEREQSHLAYQLTRLGGDVG